MFGEMCFVMDVIGGCGYAHNMMSMCLGLMCGISIVEYGVYEVRCVVLLKY